MLSKTAEYALRAVACMANHVHEKAAIAPGNVVGAAAVSADVLAKQTQVPRRYLTRVLQDLVGHGLVVSRPGPGGGYELTRSIDELTILDVVNMVDPIQRIQSCPLGLKTHHKLCPLHAELDKVYAQTEAAFKAVTIAELVESAEELTPLCESVV